MDDRDWAAIVRTTGQEADGLVVGGFGVRDGGGSDLGVVERLKCGCISMGGRNICPQFDGRDVHVNEFSFANRCEETSRRTRQYAVGNRIAAVDSNRSVGGDDDGVVFDRELDADVSVVSLGVFEEGVQRLRVDVVVEGSDLGLGNAFHRGDPAYKCIRYGLGIVERQPDFDYPVVDDSDFTF